MDDKLGFLSSDEPIVDEPIAEEPQPEAVEQPAPEPEAPAPAPVVEEPKQEAPHVPLAALLDARDKAKEAERRARELEAQLQAQAQPPQPAPDVFEDPQGFQTHLAQTFEDRLYQERLMFSRRFAEQQHGKEATEQAFNWGVERCNSDPYFNQQVRNNPDPIGFVVEQFNRDRIASTVNLSEYEQFQAWKAAQAQVTQPQASPAEPQAVPTPSMASVPSAGGVDHIPVGPGLAFDSLFQK